MRLTLRTMLAYLDDILVPEDAQDIGKKIEESEHATKLMHRTRDVMRRLRLAAPSLTDPGPGLDLNTVAEYLDNTLSDDRVPDFEKVCLESDMHLAEVACCHQILALVYLGELAEIDPALRQQMYQVPEMQAAAEARLETARTEPSRGRFGDGPTPKPRPKLVIPDYLREPRRKYGWLLPAVAALLLAGCFVLLVLVALGQFEPGTPLGNVLGIRPAETRLAGEPASAASGPKQPAATTTAKAAPISPSSSAASPPPAVTQPEVPPAAAPREPDAVGGPEKPPAGDVGMVSEPPGPSEPRTSTVEPGPGPRPAEPAMPARSKPTVEAPAEAGPRVPVEPGDKAQAPAMVGPPAEPAVEPSVAPPPEGFPEPPQPMGRLMSDRQVLLQYDAAGGCWQRVRGKGILVPQARLLVLPTYRPEVTLSAGITLQLLGVTEVELLGGDPEQPVGLKIAFGRVVIMPLANAGTRLRLIIGDCRGVLTLAQAESVAALEVTPLRDRGVDPQAGPVLSADLYATTGEILWDEGGGRQTVRITGPGRLPINAVSPRTPVAGGEFPKWIVSEPIGPLDGRASLTVETALQSDRPADLVLMELDDHRQKEVRWLAVRSEACVGRFDSMVAVLNQPDAKTEWPEYIDKLRDALARSPEAAAAIRQALEKQYPREEAAELHRMLWGYSDKDLQDGADAQLVRFLDHETLAIRLLSFWNLRELTGLGLYYSPDLSAAKRQQPIRRWKERLSAKEIKAKPPDASGKKAPGGSESSPAVEGGL